MESVLLDAAGHRRSPATMPGYHRGRPPRNKGEEYPADPPTVEEIRRALAIGALLCVIHGPTAGRRWEPSAARKQLHHAAAGAGVRRRFAPHQLRHAHAVEMAHEGVPLVVIQRQLGHANLGITSVYLQGIDSSEIISTVHGRPSATISATAGLQLRR